MYTCIYIYIHISIYTDIHVCIYTHIHISSCPAGHLRHRACCVLCDHGRTGIGELYCRKSSSAQLLRWVQVCRHTSSAQVCAGFCESRWHGHNRYIDTARYRHMRICRHTFRGSRHILQGAKIEAKQKEEPRLFPLSALPQFWPL